MKNFDGAGFAKRLKDGIEAYIKKTQKPFAQVAMDCDVTENTLRSWFTERTVPTVEKLWKLLMVTKLDPLYIITGDVAIPENASLELDLKNAIRERDQLRDELAQAMVLQEDLKALKAENIRLRARIDVYKQGDAFILRDVASALKGWKAVYDGCGCLVCGEDASLWADSVLDSAIESFEYKGSAAQWNITLRRDGDGE